MMCINTNNTKFHCRTCAKNVHYKDKAVQCDLHEHWINIMFTVTFMNIRFILNVTTLIISITDIFKTAILVLRRIMQQDFSF